MVAIRALVIEKRNTPRLLLKQHNDNARRSYQEIGGMFLRDMVLVRFTAAHAQEAGYVKRKGELLPPGSKAFKRSYSGKKFKRFGHMRPLEFSGDTKREIKQGAHVKVTKNGARVVFPAARKFNLRHPTSQIRMNEEFRSITTREAQTLGQAFDRTYNTLINRGSPETIITKIG